MVQKMDSDLPDFVGREKKGQAALRRLFFRAPEEVEKTYLWRQARTEKLPMRTVVVCPRREDWIGRDFSVLVPQIPDWVLCLSTTILETSPVRNLDLGIVLLNGNGPGLLLCRPHVPEHWVHDARALSRLLWMRSGGGLLGGGQLPLQVL